MVVGLALGCGCRVVVGLALGRAGIRSVVVGLTLGSGCRAGIRLWL